MHIHIQENRLRAAPSAHGYICELLLLLLLPLHTCELIHVGQTDALCIYMCTNLLKYKYDDEHMKYSLDYD